MGKNLTPDSAFELLICTKQEGNYEAIQEVTRTSCRGAAEASRWGGNYYSRSSTQDASAAPLQDVVKEFTELFKQALFNCLRETYGLLVSTL